MLKNLKNGKKYPKKIKVVKRNRSKSVASYGVFAKREYLF